MLIIFSHSITQTSPQLEPLVFDAGKELQLRLTRFLNDKVFIEDDDGTCQLFYNTLFIDLACDTSACFILLAIYRTSFC